jgi:hypothetical protein
LIARKVKVIKVFPVMDYAGFRQLQDRSRHDAESTNQDSNFVTLVSFYTCPLHSVPLKPIVGWRPPHPAWLPECYTLQLVMNIHLGWWINQELGTPCRGSRQAGNRLPEAAGQK